MRRVPKLTQRFFNRRRALGADSGPTARAVAQALGELVRGELPAPGDFETLMPPVQTVHAHRVGTHNLWVLYLFDDISVTLVTLTANPPVPLG